MAAPVLHVLLALLALTKLPHLDPKKFIIGTSFPDIRYLGVIEREKTHNKKATWQSIQDESCSFKAGMDFHALVDRMREKYLKKHGVYEEILPWKFRSQCMKFAEDRMIYDLISDEEWQIIASYFDTILTEERQFNIGEKYLKVWHGILQKYCSSKPSFDLIMQIIQNSALETFMTLEIQQKITELENNERYKKLIFQFYNEFLSLLENNF